MIVLIVLLVGPALALVRLVTPFEPQFLFGYVVLVSTVTYFAFKSDKKRAQSGAWRISESTLHFLELFGGWPGGFLAQRVFRHKISKTSYQVTFWLIVALQEAAAFDCLNDWMYLKKAVSHLLR